MLSNDKVDEADVVETEEVNVAVEAADVVADLALLDKLVALSLQAVHWVLRSELRLSVLLHREWLWAAHAFKGVS